MKLRVSIFRFLLVVLCAGWLPDTAAQDREFQQSAAVLAHYPDLPIKIDTPALASGRTKFTSQEELMAFVGALAQRAPLARLSIIGQSQHKRDIPMLVFSAEGTSDPAVLGGLKRPIVWLIGQQHGNEPAGGEAALAIAQALAEGELKPLLDKITVVIVPRANPDGAAARTRTTANKADPNRDHLLLGLPETQAIHTMMLQLPPDVVIDAHEFAVATRWMEKFQSLQSSDVTFQYATHPMVPRAITQLADTLYRPALEQAFKRNGLTSYWYHTTSYDMSDKLVSMGGNSAGIARNTFGLANAVSFLLETRGIGIGMQSFQRRVATHVIAARAMLELTADNADLVKRTVAAARSGATQDAADLIVAHDIEVKQVAIPLRDPESGAARPTDVRFQNSLKITPRSLRPRPQGYLLTGAPDAIASAIQRLRLNGAQLYRLTGDANVEVETYMVTRLNEARDRESINPEQSVAVTLEKRRVDFPRDTIYVPMRQAAANLIAAALEPDSPGSFIGVGILPVADSNLAPVYRVLAAPDFSLSPLPK